MSKENLDSISLKTFSAIPIVKLEDLCNTILRTLENMNTITPVTSIESVMYSAGAHFAINRLLSLVEQQKRSKQ